VREQIERAAGFEHTDAHSYGKHGRGDFNGDPKPVRRPLDKRFKYIRSLNKTVYEYYGNNDGNKVITRLHFYPVPSPQAA
jgi:hypothetical protein